MGKPPMAFYHSKGLTPAWQFAQKYIQGGGRIATLPDIIDARLGTDLDAHPWNAYFTTQSAEYVGFSRGGNKIILVAHGVGPMATLDGIQAAYSFEYKDSQRVQRGGRISRSEFLKLESGHYGPVFVVDLNLYNRRYEYPFIGALRFSDLRDDPLFMARLGGVERVERYLGQSRDYAADWHTEQSALEPDDRYGVWSSMKTHERAAKRVARRERHLLESVDPYLAYLGEADGLYTHHTPESGMAYGHLLSIGQLMHSYHEGSESLMFDLNVHGWGDGCRFIAVPAGAQMHTVHRGWNGGAQMAQYWEKLMEPCTVTSVTGLRQLMLFGEQWFTQVPSKGHSMATGQPQFLVTQKEQLGSPVAFITEVHGHQVFFRYDIRDVRRMAPPNANGFTLEDPEIVFTLEGAPGTDRTRHRATLTFYRIEVDATRQLRRFEDVENDFDTQVRLLLG